MTQKNTLTRKLIEVQPDNTKFEVFLKNGNKLTGIISNVAERTFVIANGSGENQLRSLVYFSKVSSTTILKQVPEHYRAIKAQDDDNIGNTKTKTPQIIQKKPKNRLFRRDFQQTSALTPSDIENLRFQENKLTGTN